MISRLISKRTIMGMAKRHCDKISVVGVMTAAATKDRRIMYFRFFASMSELMRPSFAKTMSTKGRLKMRPKGKTSMKTKLR